jgi:hypothetical protein
MVRVCILNIKSQGHYYYRELRKMRKTIDNAKIGIIIEHDNTLAKLNQNLHIGLLSFRKF